MPMEGENCNNTFDEGGEERGSRVGELIPLGTRTTQ